MSFAKQIAERWRQSVLFEPGSMAKGIRVQASRNRQVQLDQATIEDLAGGVRYETRLMRRARRDAMARPAWEAAKRRKRLIAAQEHEARAEFLLALVEDLEQADAKTVGDLGKREQKEASGRLEDLLGRAA